MAQQRVEGADQPPVGGDIDGEDLIPLFRLDVMERRQRPKRAGGADQDVKTPPAPVQGLAEPVDRGQVAEIARDERSGGFDGRP